MDFSYSYDVTRDGPIPLIIALVVLLVLIIAIWRVFQKAGRPGWHSIIPILSTYDLVKIGGFSGWLTLLFFVPFVNFIVYIVVALGVAKNFGKSGVFGFLGLVVFSLIGWLILGFGKAQYVGAKPAM